MKLGDKNTVLGMFAIGEWRPVLHVSGMFGAKNANLGLVVPVMQHPSNRNEVIAIDLSQDPQGLLQYSPDELRARLYTRSDELEGERPALKSIHINKSPFVAPAKMLTEEVAMRAGMDLQRMRENLRLLQNVVKHNAGGLIAQLQAVYGQTREYGKTDPEWDLYGGFFSDSDKRLMDRIRTASPRELASQSFPFEDARLPELLFRYRARNFPESLSVDEKAQWQEYCYERISREDLGLMHMERLFEEIAVIREISSDDPRAMSLMDSLESYTDTLLAQE